MFARTIRLAGCFLVLAAGLSACRGRATHPVLHTTRSAPARYAAATVVPEPAVPGGMAARAMLFQGLAEPEEALRTLKRYPTQIGQPPRLIVLPGLERAALMRPAGAAGTPRARRTRTRNVGAVGFSAVFAARPYQVAEVILDAAVEKDGFWADRLDRTGTEFGTAWSSRITYQIDMLRRGKGPIRFDFRFAMRSERWFLPDGSVLIRHDRLEDPAPVHVTLYRGLTWIEPHPQGSLVTEFLVMGTDVVVPFFLRGELRKATVELFRHRAKTIWETAALRATSSSPRRR